MSTDSRTTMLDLTLSDFADEASALDGLLSTLSSEAWLKPTPAEDWDIRDSVAHLALGDEMALECVIEDRPPAIMQEGLDALLAGGDASATFEWSLLDRGRSLSPAEVHRWWRRENAELCSALASVEPDCRLQWGPNRMSPVSFVTARIMETWAHGLDCYDAVGATPVDTNRLRHIAHLGVQALPYAFMVNGLDAPGPVRVELGAPDGGDWLLGPDDAPTVIRGAAADWCRVAVHRDRLGERERLEGVGPDAELVLRHVQAYL